MPKCSKCYRGMHSHWWTQPMMSYAEYCLSNLRLLPRVRPGKSRRERKVTYLSWIPPHLFSFCFRTDSAITSIEWVGFSICSNLQINLCISRTTIRKQTCSGIELPRSHVKNWLLPAKSRGCALPTRQSDMLTYFGRPMSKLVRKPVIGRERSLRFTFIRKNLDGLSWTGTSVNTGTISQSQSNTVNVTQPSHPPDGLQPPVMH